MPMAWVVVLTGCMSQGPLVAQTSLSNAEHRRWPVGISEQKGIAGKNRERRLRRQRVLRVSPKTVAL